MRPDSNYGGRPARSDGAGLDSELLEKFKAFSYAAYGIHFHGAKVDILKMKLIKMASVHGLDLRDFYDRLAAGMHDAVNIFLKEITVGHTFFFREDAHFKRLTQDIQVRSIRDPLIWCAASSTGEEPYSIVISLLESGLRDFRVLASDLNRDSLKAMHEGVYHVNQFQNTDDRIRRAYFSRAGEFSLRVRPELRRYIAIKRLNLHEPIEFETRFDYIFCRNVMIYFDEPGRSKVLRTLERNLSPCGLLFVGHSEALLPVEDTLRKEGPAIYRKAP